MFKYLSDKDVPGATVAVTNNKRMAPGNGLLRDIAEVMMAPTDDAGRTASDEVVDDLHRCTAARR